MAYSKGMKDEIKAELKKDKMIKQKYHGAGVYCIKIDDIIVYVGKSKDLLERVAEHIAGIKYVDAKSANKYKVLAQAQRMGYSINFDVLYSSPFTLGDEMYDDIGFNEGRYIRQYLPFLNTQIPREEDYRKYEYNKRAKYISLESILYEGRCRTVGQAR